MTSEATNRDLRRDDYPLQIVVEIDREFDRAFHDIFMAALAVAVADQPLVNYPSQTSVLEAKRTEDGMRVATVAALSNNNRNDLIVAGLTVHVANESGLPALGRRGRGEMSARFSSLYSTQETIGVVLRDWLDQLDLATTDAQKTDDRDLRKRLEELIRLVQVTVLDNETLLARIEERDLVIDQLEGHIATLHAELRRSRFDQRRAGSTVRTIGVVLASLVQVGAGFVGGVGSGLAAPAPQVQVVHPAVTTDVDVAAIVARAVAACVEYERDTQVDPPTP